MDYLKEWLEDKIKRYENISFENADSSPGMAYELGRYDSLIEIMDLLDKYGSNA